MLFSLSYPNFTSLHMKIEGGQVSIVFPLTFTHLALIVNNFLKMHLFLSSQFSFQSRLCKNYNEKGLEPQDFFFILHWDILLDWQILPIVHKLNVSHSGTKVLITNCCKNFHNDEPKIYMPWSLSIKFKPDHGIRHKLGVEYFCWRPNITSYATQSPSDVPSNGF